MQPPQPITSPTYPQLPPTAGLCNFEATVSPTTDDDWTRGYGQNSKWYRSDTGQTWLCVSADGGAAEWLETGNALHPLFGLGSTVTGGSTVGGILYVGASNALANSPAIPALQSIRRNAGNTAFEAFTPRPSNPMTTQGDLIFGGSSGVETRLAAASTGNALLSGTSPSWGKITPSHISGTWPVANGGTGITSGTNDQVWYQSGGVFAQSARFTFNGTDLSMTNATASTSGVPQQASPAIVQSGTAWNGTSSYTGAVRQVTTPHNSSTVGVNLDWQGKNGAGNWGSIFKVVSKYDTTNSAVAEFRAFGASGDGFNWGAKFEFDYDGTTRIKDLSGNASNVGAASFGLGHSSGYNQFWNNPAGYDAEITTHYGGKVLIAAGRRPWKYGDNVGNTGTEYAQCDLPFGIGTSSTPAARLEVRSGGASNVAMIAKGASSQTANLFEAQEVGGSVIAKVTAGGHGLFSEEVEVEGFGGKLILTDDVLFTRFALSMSNGSLVIAPA